ncbi:MAG: Nucleotide pyrophosphatase [Verrucomicrobiales bacterium]|nr:Nucleotide pyrophosphatase [Verrucomicrobiales bacterium]
MKNVLPLCIMIDACGWEIIKNTDFLKKAAPKRKKLRSVFGYSSTCVPSILSGRWPQDHRNWCYFVHDPENSPFRNLRVLRFLPKALTSRRIVRRALTKLVRKTLDFEGYFDLYNIPFQHISNYNFTEKKSPLKPKGMNRGDNIFDFLVSSNIPYFVSDPALTEEQNRDNLINEIQSEKIDFSFSYWPGLDGLLHNVGNRSPLVHERLAMYEEWIDKVLKAAQGHYRKVVLYVFSDHGMANCDVHIDLKSKIEKLPVKMGKDYSVVYDSTMARFWFFTSEARVQIHDVLQGVPEGRILPDEELKELKAYFDDKYFGETIFLMKEGVLIVPSHMGERPITAMHGYHPDDPQSYAALFTNQPEIPGEITDIPHICNLMKAAATQAKDSNRQQQTVLTPAGA